MESQLKYPYGTSRWRQLMIGLLLFGTFSAFFLYRTMNNEQELNLFHLIQLSVQGATVFYFVFCVFSFAMAGAGILGIYFKLTRKNFIEIDNEKIIIPPEGFFIRNTVVISFADIVSCSESHIGRKNLMLAIEHKHGKRKLISSMFENDSDYDRIKTAIIKKIQDLKG